MSGLNALKRARDKNTNAPHSPKKNESSEKNTQPTVNKTIDIVKEFEQENNVVLNKRFEMIPVDKITPSPHQARIFDTPEANAHLKALSQDIKVNGIIQPIVVRYIRGNYELIAGECRLRSVRDLLKQPDIEALIIEGITDEDASKMVYAENDKRVNLTDFEDFLFISNLGNKSIKEISDLTGKHRNQVSRILSMKILPDYILSNFSKYPGCLTARASKDLTTAVNKCSEFAAGKCSNDVVWNFFEDTWDIYFEKYKTFIDSVDSDEENIKQPEIKSLYIGMFDLLYKKYGYEAISLKHLLSDEEVESIVYSDETTEKDSETTTSKDPKNTTSNKGKQKVSLVLSDGSKIGAIKMGDLSEDGNRRFNIDFVFPESKKEILLEKFQKLINENLE